MHAAEAFALRSLAAALRPSYPRGAKASAERIVVLALAFAAMAQAPAPQMREGFAELGGVRLSYRDSGGNGVPVVFLHAATGSSQVWEHQEGPFTAAGFRVIAYDRRGFGRTVVAQAATPNATAETGADDLQALMDHLRIGRFHLVGTAAGAFVGID